MNQHRAIVRGLFALAVREYGLDESPARGFEWTRSRRTTSGAISFYRADEVQRLADHAGSEQDAAIFIIAAFTGLRANELRNLRWRSVDFADSLIHIERGYTDEGGEQLPKSYKVRSVPLMPQVAKVLAALRKREYLTTDDDLVFVNVIGKWIDRSALYRRYKLAQRAAGLGELGSTTSDIPLERWRCARSRSPTSRPGWVTPTSRRRGSTSTPHRSPLRPSASVRSSTNSSARSIRSAA